jgi:hypothetical protein
MKEDRVWGVAYLIGKLYGKEVHTLTPTPLQGVYVSVSVIWGKFLKKRKKRRWEQEIKWQKEETSVENLR